MENVTDGATADVRVCDAFYWAFFFFFFFLRV